MGPGAARRSDLERHLERQMRTQERQLIVVRAAVVAVALVVVLVFRQQLTAFTLILGLLGAVAAYDIALALLLNRFPAREVGIVATALDMAAVTIAIYAEPGALDAYLFYIPVILGAALRFGLGASLWSSLLMAAMYAAVVLLGPGPRNLVVELLPVRVAYLVGIGVAAGLFARVVIGRAGENARLQSRLDEEEREAAQLRERDVLSAMARDFSASPERDATVRAILDAAAPLLGSVTVLYLVDGDRLAPAGVEGIEPELVEAMRAHVTGRTLRIGEGIAGRVAATATAIVAGGEAPVPAFPGDPDAVTALDLRSVVAVPMLSRGAVQGILFSGSRSAAALADGERRLAEAIAERAGPALENAALWTDLQDQVVREQQAQHIKDDFLSIVSHELRTPLTSIQGYSQLLEGRLRGSTDANAKERSHLRIIRSQVARMRRLVDDLLDVSRIDKRGGVSIEPAAFDLAEELREVVARTEREHPNRKVSLDAPRSIEIEADRDRIAQVLTNLADNAAKYSPPGSPIAIQARSDGGSLIVSVADEGAGIPPEQIDLVFERFFQADDDGGTGGHRSGGLGLGLYISRAIVEAHGGSISAAPNRAAGGGTVFSFRIPVRSITRLSPLSAEPPPFVVRRREPVE